MEEIAIKSTIHLAQLAELSSAERSLIEKAIVATDRSYARYSKFRVGAAVLLENGITLLGCNQENASFPAGTCAERAAIFAAGSQYPETPVKMIAIAARTPNGDLQEEPISPCGICRQVLIETETRFKQTIRILLYGKRGIYVIDGISQLMPLCFTEF